MKRIISILLVLTLCVSFAACGKKNDERATQESEIDNSDVFDSVASDENEEAKKDNSIEGFLDSEFGLSGESEANNDFYGTWVATEIKLPSGTDMTVEYMESKKMYAWSDWKIIVSKEGPIYLQTNNTSNTGDGVVSDTGITAGRNVWVYENGKLVLNAPQGALIYYEKESDNQVFPEPQKKALVELLKGTWSIHGSRTGDFTFTDEGVSATINGVTVYTQATLNVLMDEGRLNLHETVSGTGKAVSMNLDYTYKKGVLSLTYSGDKLVKTW